MATTSTLALSLPDTPPLLFTTGTSTRGVVGRTGATGVTGATGATGTLGTDEVVGSTNSGRAGRTSGIPFSVTGCFFNSSAWRRACSAS